MRGPRLLDLYCGAGGCAVGYDRAGFDVVGVDNRPQKNYPFAFVQADALAFLGEHGREYDAIHASPPCQAYSRMRRITGGEYADLIAPTRAALIATGRPYVIENVEGAPLVDYATLCGTMFGLRARRHRLFETAPLLPLLMPPCSCKDGVATGRLIGTRLRGPKPPNRRMPPRFTDRELRAALDLDWMTIVEAGQAIPPAYTECIGAALAATLSAAAVRLRDRPIRATMRRDREG